ncbi:hypothetical protein [Streptomyces albidochromogenes]|uniref:Uncharacterized protein n=1 Tax=Streptomyces albidochromogenes TaxID=329524 RepID=A0ABW6FM24_9ACTN
MHQPKLRRLTHLQRVLAHPDLRRVWWLDQFPDRYNQHPDPIDESRGLPAPRQPGDDGMRRDFKHFTNQFLTALHTPQQPELFLSLLSQTLHILGQHDLKSTAAQ